ncbi:MAG TPA: NUDIX hydrolase [Actinomycetota bacterium]|jgi:ADP-ribose pyrophosphatase
MREPQAARDAFRGRFLRVDVEEWPDLGTYEVVRQHDAAAVLPITPDDQVLLVQQLRPPIRDRIVEIPAGLLDVEGEDALTCAARELLEETGFRHAAITFLGGVFVSPGSSNQYVHLFVARTRAERAAEPEAGIEVLVRPLGEMVAAARAGRVRDAKTALALLMAEGRVPPV